MCTLHRQPSVLAKMTATLDHISNGRVILGVGAGWNEPELTAYGVGFPTAAERITRMKEGINIMKAMWTKDKPVFKGKYYSIDGATCNPKPAQEGGPPIIVGAVGPRMLKAAVEVGDGWNLCDDPTLELYKEKLAVINEWCNKLRKNSVISEDLGWARRNRKESERVRRENGQAKETENSWRPLYSKKPSSTERNAPELHFRNTRRVHQENKTVHSIGSFPFFAMVLRLPFL